MRLRRRADGETEDGESTITTIDDEEVGEFTRRELADAMTALVAAHTAGRSKHRAGKRLLPCLNPSACPPKWATDDAAVTVTVRIADDN